ncbi:methyltransferase [Sphaerisporangium melleum]|uniref:Methyltransferase n=2 Tax=Sphaerisporangium melleum TaxID=321316 RepID=A0A917VGG5_9ACTN|nr:methyltransferase [Sphaerisporangium melleum]GII70946.1 methyltransferase [Sphaerisporangium melleum]
MMDAHEARAWVRRWDRQQENYLPDREERFTVVGDVVAGVTAGGPPPLILDLGCGPGSMSVRLAGRFPGAAVVGVDQDPVLLALARDAYRDIARFADADLAAPGWSKELGLTGPVDAIVSSTALHWIPEDRLGGLYEEAATLLRPGGVLVNADNLYDEQPAVARLAAAVLKERAARAGAGGEDWATWWRAVTAEPALAAAVAERQRRGARGGLTELSVRRHAELLRAGGFREVGTVWQAGDDVVLVAVR